MRRYLARTFLTSLMAGASEAFALAKRTTIVTPLGGTHHHPDRAGRARRRASRPWRRRPPSSVSFTSSKPSG